jgi:hypothetical protein|tara:strand:- start:132 stop:806 length:675 start_codon:yes stop_codon:yes gene_type:complete
MYRAGLILAGCAALAGCRGSALRQETVVSYQQTVFSNLEDTLLDLHMRDPFLFMPNGDCTLDLYALQFQEKVAQGSSDQEGVMPMLVSYLLTGESSHMKFILGLENDKDTDIYYILFKYGTKGEVCLIGKNFVGETNDMIIQNDSEFTSLMESYGRAIVEFYYGEQTKDQLQKKEQLESDVEDAILEIFTPKKKQKSKPLQHSDRNETLALNPSPAASKLVYRL